MKTASNIEGSTEEVQGCISCYFSSNYSHLGELYCRAPTGEGFYCDEPSIFGDNSKGREWYIHPKCPLKEGPVLIQLLPRKD